MRFFAASLLRVTLYSPSAVMTRPAIRDTISAQKPKLVTVVDEEQQSDYIIRCCLEHLENGIPLRYQAVLFRTAHHSDALEVELSRRNIPFVKCGGLKFLEAAHVKDVLSILRLAETPRDSTSAFRVLQLLDGVGPSHAKKAIAHLAAHRFDLKNWRQFTRAKNFLEVCMPLRYCHKKWSSGDRHTYAQLTRFLPDSVLPHFQRVELQPPPTSDSAVAVTPVNSDQIRAKIAAMSKLRGRICPQCALRRCCPEQLCIRQ